jgi:hypothetical protein
MRYDPVDVLARSAPVRRSVPVLVRVGEDGRRRAGRCSPTAAGLAPATWSGTSGAWRGRKSGPGAAIRGPDVSPWGGTRPIGAPAVWRRPSGCWTVPAHPGPPVPATVSPPSPGVRRWAHHPRRGYDPYVRQLCRRGDHRPDRPGRAHRLRHTSRTAGSCEVPAAGCGHSDLGPPVRHLHGRRGTASPVRSSPGGRAVPPHRGGGETAAPAPSSPAPGRARVLPGLDVEGIIRDGSLERAA